MFKYALKEKVGKTLQKPLDATRSYEYTQVFSILNLVLCSIK